MTSNIQYGILCRTTANLQYGMNVGRRQIYNMK